MSVKVDFVLTYISEEENAVQRYLETKLPLDCYIKDEGDKKLVVLHETSINNLSQWMEQVIQTIKDIDIQILSDHYLGSIMHIYISVNNSKARYILDFKGEHLMMLWKLATVIDIDYGIGFKHEL